MCDVDKVSCDLFLFFLHPEYYFAGLRREITIVHLFQNGSFIFPNYYHATSKRNCVALEFYW